jgi:cytokinin dehydrogenase
VSGRPTRAWRPDDLAALRAELGVTGAQPADREAAEKDFGQLVQRPVLAVLRPSDVAAVERIVAFANARGLQLTPRGRGMSQGGQTVPAAGVSLDLSQLVGIEAVDATARTLRLAAGNTWREAIDAAAPHGLAPRVVPLNLDLTVGGLLSVAGIGATSWAFGPAVSNVAELEVVTGGGRRVTCSATREPEVFHATLAGLGRAAIIVGARIELRPFRPQVRTFFLLFADIQPWLAAQRALVAAARADYLEGSCTPCVQGVRRGPRGPAPFAQWFYALQVTVEHEAGHAPRSEDVLAGIDGFRLVHQEDGETLAFAARYDGRFAAMRKSGAWNQPHPWVEAMLPGERAAEILTAILELYPPVLGDGPRIFFLNRAGAPPFLSMPDSAEVLCCALLPAVIPPHMLSDTLGAFRTIHERMVAAGAKRFLSGWITMMDDAALDAHFGDRAAAWHAARRQLDPGGLLDAPLTAPTGSADG